MRKVLIAAMGAVMLLGACAQEAAQPTAEQRALHDGLAAYKEGRLTDAEALFASILANKPNDPYANLNLGAIKAQTDRKDEAVAHYQLAVENGDGVPVKSFVSVGSSVDTESTVADVARSNIERLGV